MLIYYVYAYVRKSDGSPYYIGKGCKRRCYEKHSNVTTPKDKSKIIFLEKNLSNVGACALERRYIRWYGRKSDGGILLNIAEGGEGNIFTRGPFSEAHKEALKMSAKNRKLRGPHKPETIELMKLKRNLRGPWSEEVKQKMRKPKTKKNIH